MVALVAAFTVARSSSAAAQIAINSAADIPVETTSGAAQAYYEAATGNVFFSLGTDLLTAVIFNVDDQLIVDNLPPSPADVAATAAVPEPGSLSILALTGLGALSLIHI